MLWAGVLLAPVLAPAALWVVCLLMANRELGRLASAARARGEPFFAADFAEPVKVTSGPNSAALLRRAESAATILPKDDAACVAALNDQSPRGGTDVLRGIVKKNGQSLALAREARRVDRVEWETAFRDYRPLAAGAGGAYQWRPGMMLLYTAACVALLDADDAAAVEYLRDLLFHSRAVGEYPQVNQHVWSVVTSDAAVRLIEGTAPSFQVAGAGAASSRAATRGQVRALMDELLDESHLRRSHRTHMMYERSYWADQARLLGKANPLYMPIVRRDGARVVEVYDGIVDATDESTWPAARAKMKPFVSPLTSPAALPRVRRIDTVHDFTHAVSTRYADMYSSPPRPRQLQVERMFATISYRRMAAVLLALRLYQLDQAGALPRKLDELVPDYLASVPGDPYAGDGRPVGWLPDAAPPRLYCLGEDGTDEMATVGGVGGVTPFYGRYTESDVILFFDTRRSSAQRAGEQRGVAEQPGQDEQEGGGAEEPEQRQE